ncbi:hypothetical protein CMI47_04000 [Candidatus Pacearchaeota archaeon]|jgi:hypothetical protein|nr:hypothetical protein [Candidatus Pacearchaeota archaeon]|tara:strand:- start:378 stop:584 length:207 start_codon:yes stop_codon:yes gene_type:complete
MEKTIRTIKGSSIKELRTINSMYAQGKLRVFDNEGEEYRIDVHELLTLLKKTDLKAEMKRTFSHLTLA